MLETSAVQALLGLDPDLGQLLSPERLRTAQTELQVPVAPVAPGPWRPETLWPSARAGDVGLLVVDGVLTRELSVHDAPSAELFGPGDIIRTRHVDEPPTTLPISARWAAHQPSSVAVLDSRLALALRRYPEIMTVILDRFDARAERLAVAQAISQITGVETRVEALLWHLADRWGRVGTEGVALSLPLSHRMIGALVGARRPTVSTAVTRLTDAGRVARRSDGAWLLKGPRPALAATLPAIPLGPSPTRRFPRDLARRGPSRRPLAA